jgi:HEAT repeat protein
VYDNDYSTANNRRRISFLKEQINPANKPEVNKTFQIQIDAIRSAAANNIEKVESLILQKNEQLKNSRDVYESDRIFAELDGLEWLQRQIAVYALVGRSMKKGVNTKI